jgi:sugar phosphate isomerase/epimerase
MRLGGPVGGFADPQGWVEMCRERGYRAAYCPVDAKADDATIAAYVEAARRADIVIAEVGAWSNPIDPDAASRQRAIEHCQAQLALAERVGALCCVNIAGSRNPQQWDGPHPENFAQETFEMIVETTRRIIDAVQPTRTCYSLETMPWIFPSSPQEYLRLVEAINRPAFGVHLDPVNMINSPERYFSNGAFIADCFTLLGASIKSCHAKDITLSGQLTVHLDEARPGLGELDYRVLLREMHRLHPDTPLLLEHLSTQEEYAEAANYVRSIASELEIPL